MRTSVICTVMPSENFSTDCSGAGLRDHHGCGGIDRPTYTPQDDGILGTAHTVTLENLPPRGFVPMLSIQLVQVCGHENRQNLSNSHLTLSRFRVVELILRRLPWGAVRLCVPIMFVSLLVKKPINFRCGAGLDSISRPCSGVAAKMRQRNICTENTLAKVMIRQVMSDSKLVFAA